jgi:xylulose-5-phosphate/fructose-6-phosphate phosphoketolase
MNSLDPGEEQVQSDALPAGFVPLEQRTPLAPAELERMIAYWRAANYLSVGQIYLKDNPLLRRPLKKDHIKTRLLGHWGTCPGLSLVYVHLNRIIKARDLDIIYVCGPGHGGPAIVANVYLEGTYSEYYNHISQNETGMQRLFKQFSFPGGIPSHVAPETPGSIHEGGELGYSLAHAFGAAFDNPDLIAVCVVGDGEAESGPLAAGWQSNKFLNPATDGAVLPILHLNGAKIANPTILSRIDRAELADYLRGCGYTPYFVEGDDPAAVHQLMAATFDHVFDAIKEYQRRARVEKIVERPRWPVIVLATPKGWTGPKVVDGKQVEGTFRAHQVPFSDMTPEHIKLLEEWMRSYKPEELFDWAGGLRQDLAELAPKGRRRMGDNPHANGGLLMHDLELPDFRKFAVEVDEPGTRTAESTRIMGQFLADTMSRNSASKNFRLFGPDETASNRLDAVLDVTPRSWMADLKPYDDRLSPTGRVMEILSEHTIEGWIEGYTLTGRHGLFSCYEAFIHIISSMFNQHAKWLDVTREIPWRRPIPSLNYLLTSHVWRQDHNGFSHQDPGFVDHVLTKKAEITRVYLPPDANTLLVVTDKCLRSRGLINVIVAGKQPELQWLDMPSAIRHCASGIGIWDWASNDQGCEPDVVMGCAGDVPTMETLAAVDFLRRYIPGLRIRVVNVVDLMTLQPHEEHPNGLTSGEFDSLFTADKPIIFAYHGYPWLIHRLTYRRNGHDNLHVRGYKEEGTTTTPFDMTVVNELDRFSLARDVIDRVPGLKERAAHVRQMLRDMHVDHAQYIRETGDDMPVIKEWKWGYYSGGEA